MTLKKRIYWMVALVAVVTLAGVAVSLTSRTTSAGSASTSVGVPCDQQDGADDAAEATTTKSEADTDNIEQQCGDQNAADDDVVGAAKKADTDNVEEQSGDQNAADDVNEPLE